MEVKRDLWACSDCFYCLFWKGHLLHGFGVPVRLWFGTFVPGNEKLIFRGDPISLLPLCIQCKTLNRRIAFVRLNSTTSLEKWWRVVVKFVLWFYVVYHWKSSMSLTAVRRLHTVSLDGRIASSPYFQLLLVVWQVLIVVY
jgi:aryl carrier-like protein